MAKGIYESIGKKVRYVNWGFSSGGYRESPIITQEEVDDVLEEQLKTARTHRDLGRVLGVVPYKFEVDENEVKSPVGLACQSEWRMEMYVVITGKIGPKIISGDFTIEYLREMAKEIKTVRGEPWSPPPEGAIADIIKNFGLSHLWRANRGDLALTPEELDAFYKIRERWKLDGDYTLVSTVLNLARQLEKTIFPWKRLVFWV